MTDPVAAECPPRRWLEWAFVGSIGIAVGAWLATPHRHASATEGSRSGSRALEGTAVRATRSLVRGNAFPDGVVALTWDDGPDAESLSLARYLHAQRISATFFVVGEWIDRTSMEPGIGTNIYETGYERMPVLADLVELGHRLGGHTQNHVLLEADGLATSAATEQLVRSQRATDPFVTNELRMFRAPGGAWGDRAARATDDPFFDRPYVVGPVHWDIDVHDWDASLYGRGSPASEIEPGPVGPRVRAEVMARRYLDVIERTKRGVVLLHDRVGHVGSRYALDLARTLVPSLVARGYVFAAPVLAFSPVRERYRAPSDVVLAAVTDVDGDGRADICRREGRSLFCARASSERDGPNAMATVGFAPEKLFARLPDGSREFAFGNVRGHGAADLCVVTEGRIDCQRGAAGPFERWQALDAETARMPPASMQLGDIDGDGRADACLLTNRGIVCATSTGSSFGAWKVWLPATDDDARRRHHGVARSAAVESHEIELADVDGDHLADACRRSSRGVFCALSNGHGFGRMRRWSSPGDFGNESVVRFADLNGDGRSDACAAAPDGVRCALSDGQAFKRASTWSPVQTTDVRLGDLTADGRADLCVLAGSGVACGMAP